MNKKTICVFMLCAVTLIITTIKSDNATDRFAAALADIVKTTPVRPLPPSLKLPPEGKPIVIPPTTKFSAQARAKRVEAMRKKLQDNIVMTPQEVRDTMVLYLADRFVELFQGLADILGEAVKKAGGPHAQAVGESVKRLPDAFANGFLLTYNLIHEVGTAAYRDQLKAVRKPLLCLLNKEERSGFNCREYATVSKSLQGVFDHLKAFLLPLAKVLFLGVEMKDPGGAYHKVRGWIPVGVGIVAPDSDAEKDINVIADLVNIMLNFSDQYRDITGSTEGAAPESGVRAIKPIYFDSK